MASAALFTPGLEATRSTTWRQFQKALAVALALVLLGCGIYAFEKYVLDCRHRFMENPADVMMRTMGIAHFLVGWLFLFTSPRLRSWPATARLTGWTFLGGLVCMGFAAVGGSKNPFAMMAFSSFFLVHEIRDQTRLFQIYGDAPSRSAEFSGFLAQLSSAAILLLMGVLVGMHLVQGHTLGKVAILRETPAAWLLAGWSLLPVATAIAIRRVIRSGSRLFEDLGQFRTALRPLLMVYAAMFGILAVGSLLGSVGLNLIILVHVTNWLVFTHYQLSKDGCRAPGIWNWLRRSPAGFVTLHLVIAVAALALIALRVHLWERVGLISQLVAGTAFPYWSLLHICMAFWRSR